MNFANATFLKRLGVGLAGFLVALLAVHAQRQEPARGGGGQPSREPRRRILHGRRTPRPARAEAVWSVWLQCPPLPNQSRATLTNQYSAKRPCAALEGRRGLFGAAFAI
jgi:hypothetical protein